MNKFNYKSSRFIRELILLIWMVCFILFLHKFHFLHMEQLQLFYFDYHYLSQYAEIPGGFSNLIAGFLIPFFKFPFSGAGIILLLIFFFYRLRKKFFVNVISGRTSILYIQVVLLTILCVNPDFHPNVIIALIVTLLLLRVYELDRKSVV